jgi:hypothetical protein
VGGTLYETRSKPGHPFSLLDEWGLVPLAIDEDEGYKLLGPGLLVAQGTVDKQGALRCRQLRSLKGLLSRINDIQCLRLHLGAADRRTLKVTYGILQKHPGPCSVDVADPEVAQVKWANRIRELKVFPSPALIARVRETFGQNAVEILRQSSRDDMPAPESDERVLQPAPQQEMRTGENHE